MKVKDLPSVLQGFYGAIKTPEERKEFLTSFSYFADICESFELKIREDDLVKIINPSSGKIFEKRELNKMIMNLSKESLESKKVSLDGTNLLNIDSDLVNKFNKDFAEKGYGKTWTERVQILRNEVQTWTNSIISHGREIFELNKKLETLISSDGYAKQIISQIDLVAKMPEFTDVYYDKSSNLLHAITRDDCVLTGKEGTLNFGKYDCTFSFEKNKMYLTPVENNRLVNGTWIHPHVFENLDMCYGNATATIAAANENMEFSRIYQIASLILHEFNPDSPTLNFIRFKDDAVLMTDKEYKEFFSTKINSSYCHKKLRIKLYPAWKYDESKFYEVGKENVKSEKKENAA